uniref:MADS-box domain-containing protein n=1 Tax=Kalanchoe fedtschenkoi TaxID=63787 RepID=A0A7N0UU36_KALFE
MKQLGHHNADNSKKTVDFSKKASTLNKQIYELTTLCDVDACLILRTPHNQTYTWPESADQVRRVVGLFKSKAGTTTGKIARDVTSDERRLKDMPTAQAEDLLKRLEERIEALTAKIANAEVGNDITKIGSNPDETLRGEIMKRFSFQEKLKELTAGQAMSLSSELDAKIEALTTKIDNGEGRHAKSIIAGNNDKGMNPAVDMDCSADNDDSWTTRGYYEYEEYNAAASDAHMDDALALQPTTTTSTCWVELESDFLIDSMVPNPWFETSDMRSLCYGSMEMEPSSAPPVVDSQKESSAAETIFDDLGPILTDTTMRTMSFWDGCLEVDGETQLQQQQPLSPIQNHLLFT